MKTAFFLEASGPSGSTLRFGFLFSVTFPLWLKSIVGL